MTAPLISVSRCDFARDFGAFIEISANCNIGGRRAGAISLLKSPETAIEAGHDLTAALAPGGLGVDQGLHLVTPFLPFIGAADRAQILQRAEDFGEPLEVAVKGGGIALGRARGSG